MEEKANELIEFKKLGDKGYKELAAIINSMSHIKKEKKVGTLIKDQYLSTAKYNYELPPMLIWNQVDLKVQLFDLSELYDISGDMEMDNGNSFSYAVIVNFPKIFMEQVIRQQFAYYDAVPSRINPRDLGKKNIQAILQRNMKKYGRTTGANTLLEVMEIKKEEEAMEIEYLNSVEKALFG